MKLLVVSRIFANVHAESRMQAGDQWRCVPGQHVCEVKYWCFFHVACGAACCPARMSYVNVLNK